MTGGVLEVELGHGLAVSADVGRADLSGWLGQIGVLRDIYSADILPIRRHRGARDACQQDEAARSGIVFAVCN